MFNAAFQYPIHLCHFIDVISFVLVDIVEGHGLKQGSADIDAALWENSALPRSLLPQVVVSGERMAHPKPSFFNNAAAERYMESYFQNPRSLAARFDGHVQFVV